jgi:uncharacterized protein with HEPN domain
MKIDEPYLVLIKDSIDQIFSYLKNVDRENFLNDDILKDACLTRLIVIGEYSTKVSDSTKEKFPEVEWQEMKVTRNFYVHTYGQINWELIWETICHYLPSLKIKIENIISLLENEE